MIAIPIDLSTPAGREHWLKIRRNDVTASDIAAVCGWHPRRTPLTVWAEKTGKIPPAPETQLMRAGRWLEAGVLRAVQEIRPEWTLTTADVYLRDPELRIGATPDAFATREGQAGVIELKVVAAPQYERKWCSGGAVLPPLEYTLQLLTAMHLGGYTWGAIAALVIDAYRRDLEIIEIQPHPEAWNAVKTHVAQFWRHVDEGRAPDAIPQLDAETVASVYPVARSGPLDLSNDNRMQHLVAEHERLQKELEEMRMASSPIEERLAAIRTEIRDRLKDAEGATVGPWLVTLKEQARKPIPETRFRVLRIKRLEVHE